jgi:hypothetical protein
MQQHLAARAAQMALCVEQEENEAGVHEGITDGGSRQALSLFQSQHRSLPFL